ncbi:MAG: tRNA (adenosine(37)-N6)-threonylcarbamoyltransferase complex ATPase subunit type 1 TsaE [Thermodesulfobacteriota bacterium]
MSKELFTTGSPEETEELGEEFSKELSPGDVVGLTGELGSGKTCFTRGVACGLGIKGYVKSPSFTIMHVYEGGRLPLYHIDLYRIGDTRELSALGLDEYVYGEGVSVIEWAEKGGGSEELVPEGAVTVRFFYEGETERRIEIERRTK